MAKLEYRLPGAIIIGAQRCGTTRFYNLLKKHPDIAPAERKEVHFYDLRFNQGVDWYSSMFPPLEGRIGVEASPYYIFHPLCADRIHITQPGVKIIALLRNPVDRAYSHYHHEVRRADHEKLSFEEALDAESDRLRGTEEDILSGNTGFNEMHNHYSYTSRGMYARQLERYWGRFPIHLIKSEDFYDDEVRVLRGACEFLGIDKIDWRPAEFSGKEKYPPMNRLTRVWLKEFFEPHNEDLRKLTGRDFGW